MDGTQLPPPDMEPIEDGFFGDDIAPENDIVDTQEDNIGHDIQDTPAEPDDETEHYQEYLQEKAAEMMEQKLGFGPGVLNQPDFEEATTNDHEYLQEQENTAMDDDHLETENSSTSSSQNGLLLCLQSHVALVPQQIRLPLHVYQPPLPDQVSLPLRRFAPCKNISRRKRMKQSKNQQQNQPRPTPTTKIIFNTL
jgi:hypothetical protein